MAAALTRRRRFGLVTAMLIALLIAAAQPALAPSRSRARAARGACVQRLGRRLRQWRGAARRLAFIRRAARTSRANGIMTIERGPEAEAPLVVRLAQVEGAPARLARLRRSAAGAPCRGRGRLSGRDRRIAPRSWTASSTPTRSSCRMPHGAALGQLSLQGPARRHALHGRGAGPAAHAHRPDPHRPAPGERRAAAAAGSRRARRPGRRTRRRSPFRPRASPGFGGTAAARSARSAAPTMSRLRRSAAAGP